tara:strand:+ start:225 stop:2108 length:1884 start_codon:yes stop_codon:yes gene_type:complete
MSYKVLALKWRPNKFDEVIGQEHITKSLKNAIELNRISHAFTFTGPRGVGKTTTARILAKELNNIDDLHSSFDVIEMDAASNRGIDEIRNLRENVSVVPAHGKYKIYIIDEVHMLTKEAFNALLKTLEEPPPNVIFILATTDPYKIPATILSRTQRFDFRRLTSENIIKQLKIVLDDENKDYESDSLKVIADKSEGSMRDALGYLDQLLNYSSDKINKRDVYSILGVVDESLYNQLFIYILDSNTLESINLVKESVNAGVSVKEFLIGFNRFLRKELICLIQNQHKKDIIQKNNLTDLDIVRMMELAIQFEAKIKFYSNPNSALEIFIIKLANLDSVVKISDLVNSLDNGNYERLVKKDDLGLNNDFSIQNKPNKGFAEIPKNNKIEIDNKSNQKHVLKNKKEISNNELESSNEFKQVNYQKNNQEKSLDENSYNQNNLNDEKNNDKTIVENRDVASDNNLKINEELDVSSNNLEKSNLENTANHKTSIKTQIENNDEQNNLDVKIKKFINHDKLIESYQTVLSIIEKENSKTASFLADSEISKIEENKIYIKVDKVNNFVFNSLSNDSKLIEKSFKSIFNIEYKVFLEKGNLTEIKRRKVINENSKDDEHPLFMDALNKFDGDIIK